MQKNDNMNYEILSIQTIFYIPKRQRWCLKAMDTNQKTRYFYFKDREDLDKWLRKKGLHSDETKEKISGEQLEAINASKEAKVNGFSATLMAKQFKNDHKGFWLSVNRWMADLIIDSIKNDEMVKLEFLDRASRAIATLARSSKDYIDVEKIEKELKEMEEKFKSISKQKRFGTVVQLEPILESKKK